MSRFCLLAALILPFSESLAAAPPSNSKPTVTFARPPAVTKAGDGARIEFAASAATDCEVCVLDAAGRTVRHLAAGVLGDNAPEPLAKGSLAQSLVWDSKNDLGGPAGAGPFKVQVRLGLTPAFDGLIGNNPAAVGAIRMLATGPGGEVFVMHSQVGFGNGSSHALVAVFDRSGKYLRTILPPPANLLGDKSKGLRQIEVEPGVKAPFIYNAETRAMVPGIGGERFMHRGVVARDGRLVMVGCQEILREAKGQAQIVVIRTDGSVPDPVKGTVLTTTSGRSTASLALSPDQKTVYATGLRLDGYALKADHAVYAFGFDDKSPRLFAGKPAEAGNSETLFSEPTSVSTDKDGNVYVADKLNDRIVVLKPDGSFLGSVKVERPERVEVHARTSAIYVLGGKEVDTLMRFNAIKAPEPAIKVALPRFKHRLYTAVIALDSEAARPVIWAGSCHNAWIPLKLIRVEDNGDSFSAPAEASVPDAKVASAAKATDLALLPAASQLLLWPSRDDRRPRMFNPRTGEVINAQYPRLVTCGNIVAAGRDGNYYIYYGFPTANVARYDSQFKRLPFQSRATTTGPDSGNITDLGSPRTRGRGLTADARGNVYVLVQKADPTAVPDAKGAYGDANAVRVFGPDGKLLKEALIDSDIRSLNSVRVDHAGNVYLALGARPAGQFVPANLTGQVPDDRKDPGADCGNNYYPLMYGTIVKFAPEGGAIRTGGEPASGGVPMEFGYASKIAVHNAQWTFFGASTVPSFRTKNTPNICLCESPQIDVDGFGRTFFPDACGFRVGVLDTAGNLICWFGRYGNADSAGPGSAIPAPAIPLGWPAAVAVDDASAFVGDRLNGRVVRVKLDCAASEVRPIN